MIPGWNVAGVLPPIRPGKPGNNSDRSPYVVQLQQVVDHFATSPERINILRGLLDYRKALHSSGINVGFQWLDGSFVEQVELLEARPPRDVDVVTFFNLPIGKTQKDLFATDPDLFNQGKAKNKYNVDAYFIVLGQQMNGYHIKMISYWYSMWSHRRDGLWKGFIQVDLSPNEDIIARKAFDLIQQVGGHK